MKKIITLLALTASFVMLVPSTSQARDGRGHSHSSRSYSHACRSCGGSVYRERCVTGHDRHGHPVYGYRTAGHSCRSSHGRGHGHHDSHGHGHHGSHGGSRGHVSLPGFHVDFGRR